MKISKPTQMPIVPVRADLAKPDAAQQAAVPKTSDVFVGEDPAAAPSLAQFAGEPSAPGGRSQSEGNGLALQLAHQTAGASSQGSAEAAVAAAVAHAGSGDLLPLQPSPDQAHSVSLDQVPAAVRQGLAQAREAVLDRWSGESAMAVEIDGIYAIGTAGQVPEAWAILGFSVDSAADYNEAHLIAVDSSGQQVFNQTDDW